ncbi:unnamed protein product [Calypogeia fissa]
MTMMSSSTTMTTSAAGASSSSGGGGAGHEHGGHLLQKHEYWDENRDRSPCTSQAAGAVPAAAAEEGCGSQ